MFALGRNHPVVRETLKKILDSDLPNLVQMDLSALAGILTERLLRYVPHLDKAFFANSGSETVEAAINFARAATGRSGIVYCSHAFHSLTYGSLSLNGDQIFRFGFEPLLPDCVEVPFSDVPALDRALASRQIAAFVVEPIQGKGVDVPGPRLFAFGVGALPQIRDNLRRRRDPDRARPQPAVFSPANIGQSSRTWSCWQSRCPAATSRSA